MKVKFYPDDIESDVIEIPDDTSEDELCDMACEWVANNVAGFWKIVSGGEQYVREKRPEIEGSIDYVFWKLARQLGDVIHDVCKMINDLTPDERKQMLLKIENDENLEVKDGENQE